MSDNLRGQLADWIRDRELLGLGPLSWADRLLTDSPVADRIKELEAVNTRRSHQIDSLYALVNHPLMLATVNMNQHHDGLMALVADIEAA